MTYTETPGRATNRSCIRAQVHRAVQIIPQQSRLSRGTFFKMDPRLCNCSKTSMTFSSVKDTLDTCSPSLHLATSVVEYIKHMHVLGKIALGKAIKKCKSCGYYSSYLPHIVQWYSNIIIRASAMLALHLIGSWESPVCHRHLAGSSQAMLAVWMVPVGKHWLDGANIVYTGVCNT